MPAPAVPLLESFSALADPTRCRMLLVLERHELTVSELCAVLQLPQSTVSRHLKLLGEAELVVSRREGTSRYYSLAMGPASGPQTPGLTAGESAGEPQAAGRGVQAAVWQLARRELMERPGAAQDVRRLERVLAERSAASREFFASTSVAWDRLRDELFGNQFYVRALLGLLPGSWVMGDLGCGTGAVAAALAPHVAQVIGVDASEEMLQAASQRLGTADGGGPCGRVQLRRGALEALPIDEGTLDAATMVLVLHHLAAPAKALIEARRVLKPGGRLLIVDMAPHEREEYRRQMGHVWLGFSEEQICRLLEQSGFGDVRYHSLPVVSDARGPALFAAAAARAA